MIQKITQNNGNFWTVNLIMRAKIVNQSSDFPVRRTVTKKHWELFVKNKHWELFVKNKHWELFVKNELILQHHFAMLELETCL